VSWDMSKKDFFDIDRGGESHGGYDLRFAMA
jgi:hypothetical protein